MFRGLTMAGTCLAAATAQQLVHVDGALLEGASAAFDPSRGRLVVPGRLGETWENDRLTWFRRAADRDDWADGRAVYDGSRVLVFATSAMLAAQTWTYDGIAWQRHTPPVQPPPRTDTMLAYDSVRSRAVLFAGTATVGPNYYLTDTWEYDGSTWILRAPTGTPPWRRSAAFTFDPRRRTCLLFGGDGQSGFRQDTWEWDGVAWLQRGPAVRPSARIGAAATYDAARGRVVLQGGLSAAGLQGDVWTWDGVTWLQIAASAAGPAVYEHSLHHDPANGDLLVVGGTPTGLYAFDASGVWRTGAPVPYVAATGGPGGAAIDPATGGVVRFGSLFDNGTHVWNGFAWSSLTPPLAPPRRIFSAMWNDGQSAWLFGGANTLQGASYGDTWRWDGALWWPVAGPGPSPRMQPGVAFDAVRGVAVLFGGYANLPLDDTWTFDGVAWSPRSTPVRPPARSQHGLAFDPLRGRTVLFGGTGVSLASLLDDTWEWDGTTWAQRLPTQSPPAVGTVALGFDARRQRILLSQSGTQMVATLPPSLWTYDGTTWTPLPLAQNLAIQPVHAVLTRPGELDPLLVDGYSILRLTNQPAAAASLGVGCGATPLRAWVRSLPRLPSPAFGFEIDRAPAGAPMALLLATSPGALVVAGCAVGVDPSGPTTFLLADARGMAELRLALPAQPGLLGVSLFGQAFALVSGSPSGFAASPTVRATLGE